MHGFNEFFGNVYHQNAEEPENIDYPKSPSLRAEFGPCGVFKCTATDTDNCTRTAESAFIPRNTAVPVARWTEDLD